MKREEVTASSLDVLTNDSLESACQTSFGNEGINNYRLVSETGIPGDCGLHGSHHAALAACDPADASPLLDPYTPESDQAVESVKSFFARRRSVQQRRVYSRIYWGLQLPGRYAFLTFTNTSKGDRQLENWKKIKKWMKRHYPGIDCCRVFTDEGGGVIHAVVRQGMRQKRIDKDELDEYLETIGCGFTWIRRVRENQKAGLAAYLSDQRHKRGMSKEMANQTLMTKYNYFGEWLPPGWIGKFGRAWYRTNGMHLQERLVWFKKWLLDYRKDPGCWCPCVPVTWDSDVGWIQMMPEELERG